MNSKENFFVSADKSLLQISKIHRFLSTQAYWCLEISREVVEKSIRNSLCFGLYDCSKGERNQVGFARVVTDAATFAWLCDVYIEADYRRQGLASWLMKSVIAHADIKNLRRFCLTTKDSHGLYEKFGFQVSTTPGNWMEIKDNDIYKKVKSESTAPW